MWERLILAMTMTVLLHVSMQSQPTSGNSSQSFFSHQQPNSENELQFSPLISRVQPKQSDPCSPSMTPL